MSGRGFAFQNYTTTEVDGRDVDTPTGDLKALFRFVPTVRSRLRETRTQRDGHARAGALTARMRMNTPHTRTHMGLSFRNRASLRAVPHTRPPTNTRTQIAIPI